MNFTIKNETIANYNKTAKFDFPKYTSQLINWANQNAQGTRPAVVGQMSELFPEFMDSDCEKTGDQKLDESEFIKYVEVDLSDLDFLLHHGYIKGLNSAYAIEKAKTFIKEMK